MKRPLSLATPIVYGGPIGPLHPGISDFTRFLMESGYSISSIDHRRRLITALDHWCVEHQIDLKDFNEDRVEQFLLERRKHYSAQFADFPTLRCFLQHLRNAQLVPSPAIKGDTNPMGRLLEHFRDHLAEERGLKEKTQEEYLKVTRSFLCGRFRDRPIVLHELNQRDVGQFVLCRARKTSPVTGQRVTSVLRSFFRFLYHRGDIQKDLGACVPTVANWSLSPVPKYLSAEKVELLLEQCDQASATGQRDHTILLLLARLGLRAGEVVNMELEDIDWDVGELSIKGKGNRQDRLPIPEDVGKALARYLQKVRPRCTSRRVFIRMHAPHQGFRGPSSVTVIVHQALNRAGLNPAHRGAHILRHSLATRMLGSGASLTEIGKILRHQLIRTTAIYAKVDLAVLRALAQPWPGGEA